MCSLSWVQLNEVIQDDWKWDSIRNISKGEYIILLGYVGGARGPVWFGNELGSNIRLRQQWQIARAMRIDEKSFAV